MKPLLRPACLAVLLIHTLAAQAAELLVQEARINAAPPTVQVLAGYLSITNHGQETAVINTFESPGFERVELHETRIEQDVASMQRLDQLIIGPGETATLQPGAMHLMFIKPASAVRVGDSVKLFLGLADGSELRITMDVSRPVVRDDHSHHH